MHPVFFQLHSDLEREAPGSAASTRRGLDLVPPLPSGARVLDLGAGPGAQTLELARRIDGTVLAVDNHAPYLAALRRRAAREGLADRIETREADLTNLALGERFDLVWSEGAIYIVGFAAGLAAWRPLLAERRCLAVTEATWLVSDPPAACRAFWEAAYSAMTDVATNLATARSAGYRPLGHFALPPSDWEEHYYRPLEARMNVLRERHRDDPEALEALEGEALEIRMFREHGDAYGYVFYVLERDD